MSLFHLKQKQGEPLYGLAYRGLKEVNHGKTHVYSMFLKRND